MLNCLPMWTNPCRGYDPMGDPLAPQQVTTKALTHKSAPKSRLRTKGAVALLAASCAGILLYFSYPATHRESLSIGSAPDQPQPDAPTFMPPLPSKTGAQTDSAPPFPNLPAELPATTELLLEELIQVTTDLQKRFPNNPDSLEISARVQLWLGHTDQAVRLWQECLQLDPAYGHAYYGLGTVAAKAGDYETAADFFRKANQLPLMSSQTQIPLADALLNTGQIEEAISILNGGPAAGPLSAQRETLLGQAYLQAKNYETARTHFDRAVSMDPLFSDAQYGLAMVFGRLGKSEEAAECMARFNELRTQERKIRTADKREYDDDEATRWEAAKKYTDVGALFFSQGLVPEAENIWQRAARLAPKDTNCRQALAWLYRQAGRREDAIRILQQLAELTPNGIEYPLEVGRIRAELGEFDTALKLFQQVREKAPHRPDGYLAAARLHVAMKSNPPLAVALATKGATMESTAANYELLSQAHELDGNREQALAAIILAMSLDPDEPRYQERHKQLKARQ